MSNIEVKLNFKGGGSFVNHRPVFSDDGGTVYVCWKNIIYGYNTKTSKRILEFTGLSNAVIGFKYHYLSDCECITACSLNGEVVTWKAQTALRIIKKNFPLQNVTIKTFNVIPLKHHDGDCVALVSYTCADKNTVIFCLFNITNTEIDLIKMLPLKKKHSYSVDVNDVFFAVTQGKKLYYVFLNNKSDVNRCVIGNNRKFTCVACHPKRMCILTGDSIGRVIIWKNLNSSNCVQAVYHWHTLPVNTVCFSTSGSYFYSGAGECVLVKWQFDDVHQKSFFPRLPAPIEHVSVSDNNLYVAISSKDNSIRIVDPKFELIGVIQHLVLGNQFESGIHIDFRTRSLVMNGITGHIQFYSPKHMDLLYNLDIVGQNKLTDERECSIENTQVTRIALSKSGMWMATCEELKNDTTFEARLKFFVFDALKQNFQLNTVIEYPHQKSINDVLFQPTKCDEEIKCITIGQDKKFKLWQIVEITNVDGVNISWNCQYVGFYKNLPNNAVTFSRDGSLLAIGFGEILTTWLPDSCELKCSLFHPNTKNYIKHIEFGFANECHLLVAATEDRLSVWNLLTLSMVWTVTVQVSLLVADPLTNNMALFTTDNNLFVFTPSSPQPIFTANELMSKTVQVVASAFVPSAFSNDTNNTVVNRWYHHSHLYFIDSNQELYYFGANEEAIEPFLFQSDETSTRALFDKIIPKHKSDSRQVQSFVQHHFIKDPSCKNLEKFLDSPVHTMIPMRLTCGPILHSFVIEAKS